MSYIVFDVYNLKRARTSVELTLAAARCLKKSNKKQLRTNKTKKKTTAITAQLI